MNLGWIEGSLRYAGRFGAPEKIAYCEVFGVSEATASRHQARAASEMEDVCGDDIFERSPSGRLLRGSLFMRDDASLPDTHIFPRVPPMERWLEDALGSPHYHAAEIRRAEPEPYTLRTLVRSIQDEVPVHLIYGSRTGQGARVLSPHILVRVVGRFHVRGWDHGKNEYRDFVLSRIFRISQSPDIAFVKAEKDREWKNYEKIVISDKGDDEGKIRDGICRDYGLDLKGQRVLRVRQALVGYLVDVESSNFENPVSIQRASRDKKYS